MTMTTTIDNVPKIDEWHQNDVNDNGPIGRFTYRIFDRGPAALYYTLSTLFVISRRTIDSAVLYVAQPWFIPVAKTVVAAAVACCSWRWQSLCSCCTVPISIAFVVAVVVFVVGIVLLSSPRTFSSHFECRPLFTKHNAAAMQWTQRRPNFVHYSSRSRSRSRNPDSNFYSHQLR